MNMCSVKQVDNGIHMIYVEIFRNGVNFMRGGLAQNNFNI